MQKDNTTLQLKTSLRRNALKEIELPVVMETHGGYGAIFANCYFGIVDGVAFESKPDKAAALAKQRPTWAVYESDCVMALKAGIGNHLPVNFLDLDPYGDPWQVMDAFFQSDREFPDKLAIVVNDGLRQNIKISGGWSVGSMAGAVVKYGAAQMHKNYLAICRELLEEKAGQRNYTLTRWAGYHCGYLDQITHYAAILEKPAEARARAQAGHDAA